MNNEMDLIKGDACNLKPFIRAQDGTKVNVVMDNIDDASGPLASLSRAWIEADAKQDLKNLKNSLARMKLAAIPSLGVAAPPPEKLTLDPWEVEFEQ